jgi:hypothetical protein
MTFEELYRTHAQDIEVSISEPGFVKKLRQAFVSTSLQRQHGSSAHAHLRTVQQYQMAWRQIRSNWLCLLCLAQEPSSRNALSCEHWLCSSCLVLCDEESQPNQGQFQLAHCPLCRCANEHSVSLRPPTAGLRLLRIDAEVKDKAQIWQMLKSLQSEIHLPLSLRDHFDLVIASGAGTFFAFTIFAKEWALEDCKYHLGNVRTPKGNTSKGSLAFGKGLSWDLGSMPGCEMILHLKDQIFRNTLIAEADIKADLSVVLTPSSPPANIQLLSHQLIASLFYIELASYPKPGSQTSLRVKCRIPSGASLVSLVTRLHHYKATAFIKVKRRIDRQEIFVTPAALGRCRDGSDFRRTFLIDVPSQSAVIDIQLNSANGNRASLSKCPYSVSALIKDQGLDCIFGRSDHRHAELADEDDGFVIEEMDSLQQELNEMLTSTHWSVGESVI